MSCMNMEEKIDEAQNRFETHEHPQEPRPKFKNTPMEEPNFGDVPKKPMIKEFLEDSPNWPKWEKNPLNPKCEKKPPQAPVMNCMNMEEKLVNPKIDLKRLNPLKSQDQSVKLSPRKNPISKMCPKYPILRNFWKTPLMGQNVRSPL